MTKFGLLGSSALRSIAFAGVALSISSPLLAQGVPADQDPPQTLQSEPEIESGEAATGDESIVVTGSRIRRPNLESTVPITSLGGEEFFQTGQTSVGDVLNELPALRSTFSQSNSTRFLGTAGLNLLDLRGLGTQRTLVLVNGRRHVGSDVLNNAVSPDVNTFPTDLIERVDIVTGGNSAIYGSDAIAGVVNFILKKDYEGLQVRGQGGVSQYGDAGSYFVSALAGTNFADDRGNIALNVEYARQNQYFGAGRPNLRQNDAFVIVDTDIGESSDGVPDRLFFRDIRSGSLSNTGTVRFGGGVSPVNCGADPVGGFYSCNYIFTPEGTLVAQTGDRIGIAPPNNPGGSFIGGNGESFRSGQQFQIYPRLDRINANLIGHFSVSDAFEPFIEAKYARTDSLGAGSSGPAFYTGSTIDAFYERPRIDNPFLRDDTREFIRAQLLAAGTNPANGNPLTAGQIAAINNGSFRFPLRINLLGLGIRQEEAERETYRGVVGIRGDFNDDWQYEVSANYGKFKEKTTILGNLNVQRILLGLDAVRNDAGQIVCGSQIDPTRAYDDFGGNPDRLAADIAACIPINPFGGQFTPEQRAYLVQDTTAVGEIKQFVVNGFVSGDSSQWFELPGGPIGFALGAEYREESVLYQQDPLVEQGLTFYNAIPTFDPPKFKVKEAFGEIRLPILRDMPFFHELTVSAAGRVADYNLGTTGTVFAYNAGVDWAPVRDLRLRGNYSRAVRAPNVVDLFTPLGQNFAPAFVDPCALNQINTGSPNRVANCRAAGIPADYNFAYSQSLELQSGGNPDLQAETSDSFTIGGVFQPRFIPGLSVSVDYFDITVDDVITSPTPQQIVDACYDAADLNNQFCQLFVRAGPEGAESGEEPFRIIEGSLEQRTLNYAKLTARGIDAELAYRHSFAGVGDVSTRFTYTRVLERNQFLDPSDPGRADQVMLELGDPQDAFNWNLDLKNGPLTLGYQMRYIGKMVLNQYEDFFSVQGREPENADYADRRFYPDVFYHDVRLGFEVNKNFNFYTGIDNVTNRKPPLGLTGIGAGSSIYDVRGRFFYAGAVAKF